MTFDREIKGMTFGLFVLLAIAGNYGLLDWLSASRGLSMPGWVLVLGGMVALVPEVIVLGLIAQCGSWTPGLVAGTGGLLVVLLLVFFSTVRFAFAFEVILSWFAADARLHWFLLVPGLAATLLYFFCADSLQDEESG